MADLYERKRELDELGKKIDAIAIVGVGAIVGAFSAILIAVTVKWIIDLFAGGC